MKDKFLAQAQSYEADMIAMLEKMVNIDSGFDCPEGINAVAHIVGDKLTEIGFSVEYQVTENGPTSLLATRKGSSPDAKEIMILGHMDTVFKKGTAAERPFRIDGEKAFGPGVLDMKSGIVIACHALKTLSDTDLFKHNITCFFCGDEETGHPLTDTKDAHLALAKGKDAVFNMETGSDTGTVVIGRSGMRYAGLSVEGIAAHSGKDPDKGASAIREMIKKVEDLYAFSENDPDVMFNAGTINGGIVANGIPANCEMRGDFRFKTAAGHDRAMKALEEIAAKQYIPNTKTTVVSNPKQGFMPMEVTEGNLGLFEVVKAQGVKLGIDIKGIEVGGCSDSCWTTFSGVPSVCAMGARGEFNHSTEEYILLYSLVERATLLALTIDAL